MADVIELEKFREQWKKELKQQREVKVQRPSSATSTSKLADDASSKDVNKEKGSEKAENKQLHSWSGVEEAKVRPNVLPSFLIAEGLLRNGSSSSQSNDEGPVRRKSFGFQLDQPQKKIKTSDCDTSKEERPKKKTSSFLDLFIADLDEINEIPFFDLELPRELALKIFQHLDVGDLCRCAQVSKSWKSLAEDEYLWCNLCHKYGYEESSLTVDRQNWKGLMVRHVNREHEIKANWKMLTGDYRQLHYERGGVLCAASSYERLIVGGYTSGEVKFWDLKKEEDCIFKPSSVALALDELNEQGTVINRVTTISLNQQYTVAGYSQGYVDVWSNERGTSPVHSFRGPGSVTDLQMCMEKGLTCAVTFGSHIRVETITQEGFQRLDSYDVERISHVLLIHEPQVSVQSDYMLAYSMGDMLNIHVPGTSHDLMTTVHHVIGQGVTCMDHRLGQLAFGVTSYDWPLNNAFKVKVVCLNTHRDLVSLEGHPGKVECLNIRDSPPNMAVTGCIDGRVRVFDLRVSDPILTLTGLSSLVRCVQMDDWKVVAGSQAGMVTVWDQRMAQNKLWEIHNRHPIQYLHFKKEYMVCADVPYNKTPDMDEDNIPSIRYRGNIQVYDFMSSQVTQGIPNICMSTYDEPEAYNYNVKLAMPYDKI